MESLRNYLLKAHTIQIGNLLADQWKQSFYEKTGDREVFSITTDKTDKQLTCGTMETELLGGKGCLIRKAFQQIIEKL